MNALDTIEGETVEIREPVDPNIETDAEAISRLAELSPFEYDRVREAEADKIGVRIGTLDKQVAGLRITSTDESDPGRAVLFDEPEAWPDLVDGAALLSEIFKVLTSHVILSPDEAVSAALWVLHTHAYDTASISPILAVTSPTPECGKTTLLTLLGALVRKPLTASNITSAALFRSVEKWAPTLLVDEADTFLRDNDELRGIINSGHNRASAFIIRTSGEDHEPRRFMTWAPKAIALIGKLPATLASRAIHIELKRLTHGESVAPVRADRLTHLQPLARKAIRWSKDHSDALQHADPVLPAALRGRDADNWHHLLAIADAAGGEWSGLARRAAEAMANNDDAQTAGITILADIRALFAERSADRLSSTELAEALGVMEDRQWSEWQNGKPITTRQIARLLAPFEITPTKFRQEGRTPGTRGYERDAFEDAFARYLADSPAPSATAPQLKDTAPLSGSRSATGSLGVADKHPLNAPVSAACGAVADTEPQVWRGKL
jgi:hypothetical protein